MKLIKWPAEIEHHQSTYHWCPGCERLHVLPDAWTRTGSDESPTYVPSFLQHERKGPCHYVITVGVLHYQPDCWHPLRGPVPMPDIPAATIARLTDALFEM